MAENNNLQFYHSGYSIDDPQQGQNNEQAYHYQQAAPPLRGYEPAGYSSYGVEQMDATSSGDGIFGTMGQMESSQQPVYEYGQASGFEDEPPLLEELGINFDHIIATTKVVLNPLNPTDPAIMNDADLAGPLVFCLLFGGMLLLSGKVHFGYIYGMGLLGCVSIFIVLNLMSMVSVSVSCVVSVLGYCLLPMVLLSALSLLISLQGIIGTVLTIATVIWCSWSASKLFITALQMDSQQPLVAYPCALVYAVFALLTVF